MRDDFEHQWQMGWLRAQCEALLAAIVVLAIAAAGLALLCLEDAGRIDLDGRQWAALAIIAGAVFAGFIGRRGIARAFREF